MEKKKIYLCITVALFLLAVILAFSGALLSSTIYNGEIPLGIGKHVFVITLIALFATIPLFLYVKTVTTDTGISTMQYAALGGVALSGFLFALASGYQGRAAFLLDYYNDIRSQPAWYAGDVLGSSWFPTIPGVASGYSSVGTTWYIITCLVIVGTVAVAVKVFPKEK